MASICLINYEYLSLSFEEIVKTVYTGHEIASPTNRYRKLIATYDYGVSYRRGVQYCSGKSFYIRWLNLPLTNLPLDDLKGNFLWCNLAHLFESNFNQKLINDWNIHIRVNIYYQGNTLGIWY